MEILKKYTLAIVAAVMVIGFSAFKVIEKSAEESFYWFEYDASGTTLENQPAPPTPSPTPPAGCDGDQVNCAKAFTSYNMVSPNEYAPGTEALDDQNNEIIRHKNSQ